MKELTNPITDYRITLMDSTGSRVFGWLQLLNGDKAAGYIYFGTEPQAEHPHLGGGGTYIVMDQPANMLGNLLTILRNEKNLTIRFFDSETPGNPPSAFLETGGTQIGASTFEDPNLDRINPN